MITNKQSPVVSSQDILTRHYAVDSVVNVTFSLLFCTKNNARTNLFHDIRLNHATTIAITFEIFGIRPPVRVVIDKRAMKYTCAYSAYVFNNCLIQHTDAGMSAFYRIKLLLYTRELYNNTKPFFRKLRTRVAAGQSVYEEGFRTIMIFFMTFFFSINFGM